MKKLIILFLTFLIVVLVLTSVTLVATIVASTEDKIHVYLDPGHGGFDGGAVGINNVFEKTITLTIALKVMEYLKKTGIIVSMTRNGDYALANNKRDDIYKRVDLINKSRANLYISIHANSFPVASVKGAQTFYNNIYDDNRELSEAIQEMLYEIDPTNHRKAKAITGKYLIDEVTLIGCLVEVGFLTNPDECEKLTSNEYQAQIALMIYLGILRFLEKYGEV